MDSKELQKLIEGCKKDSRKARAKLYKVYAPLLLGICLRYTKNKSEAEDVLHDGFIKIYTKIDQTGRGSFEAWMKTIVRNEALQYLRKQVSTNKWNLEYGRDNFEEFADDQDVDIASISSKKILEFIQALPAGYRLIFNLYVFEEHSHKQIAELLEISEGTSKSQFSRAKKVLQKQIIEYKNQGLN